MLCQWGGEDNQETAKDAPHDGSLHQSTVHARQLAMTIVASNTAHVMLLPASIPYARVGVRVAGNSPKRFRGLTDTLTKCVLRIYEYEVSLQPASPYISGQHSAVLNICSSPSEWTPKNGGSNGDKKRKPPKMRVA